MKSCPLKKCAKLCHSSSEYGEIGDGEKSKQNFNKLSYLGKVYYMNSGAQTAESVPKRTPGKIYYLDSGVQATEGIFIPKRRSRYTKTISLYTIEEEPWKKKFCSYSACKIKPEGLFTKKIKSSIQHNDLRKKPDVLFKKKINRSMQHNELRKKPSALFKKKINRSMQHNDLRQKSDVLFKQKVNRSMQHNDLRKELNSRSIQYKKRTVQRKTQTMSKNDIDCGDFVISKFDKKPSKYKFICRRKPSKSNKELCKIFEGVQKDTQTSLNITRGCSHVCSQDNCKYADAKSKIKTSLNITRDSCQVCNQDNCKYADATSKINVHKSLSQNTKSKILMYFSDVCKRDKYRYRTRKGIDTGCKLCNMNFKTSSVNQNLNKYGAKEFPSCIANNKECFRCDLPCVPRSYPSVINQNVMQYNSSEYQSSDRCICEKCGCPKRKKSTEKSTMKKSSDNYIEYNKYNYHSREGLNIGQLKACVTQMLSMNDNNSKSDENMPKSQCTCAKIIAKQKMKRKKYLKKKRLKQKAKRIRKAKRIKRKEKRDEKRNLKQFKKELKRLKKEKKEVSKIDESYDTHCRADVIVGTLSLAVQAIKGILKIIINVITAPKQSQEYIETRLTYPKTTFERLSRWWTVTWKRQKLRITRSIKGSRNMTILTDEVQETPLYKAFECEGNTEEERLAIERESVTRRRRMAKRRKEAISCYGSLFLVTLRKAPCLWVYHIWPNLYPQFLKLLVFLKNFANMMLFFLAVLVWTPCILCVEVCRVTLCMCL